jgi:glyoxylase-like metal-dependent hydrolase (beta-lactamase superfamily II)
MNMKPLSIQTHTASDPGFAVNSHLLMSENDAILVDAQFTRSEARKVADMVKTSGKNLILIYVTHGHPDHYLGLEILTKEFPDARVLSTRNVAAYIENTAQNYITQWKPIYKDDLADSFIVPHVIDSSELELEGERIQIIELGPGESDSASALYIPSMKVLVSGDSVFNKVHLWLAEKRIEGWLKNIHTLQDAGDIEIVLPGHGLPANSTVIKENIRYIEAFVRAIMRSKTKDEALEKIKKLYPGYRLEVIAQISTDASFN